MQASFFRKGVEVDEVRKLLFLPNNPPIPVGWRASVEVHGEAC